MAAPSQVRAPLSNSSNAGWVHNIHARLTPSRHGRGQACGKGSRLRRSEGWDWSSGSVNTSSANFLPRSLVGLVTFTPATGTFHAHWIARLAGANYTTDFDGNYTVDANGHGTMAYMGANGPNQRGFYIVNAGAELKWINTDPPGTALANSDGTMTKQ